MFSIAGIDLLEQELLNHERTLLEILLQDKTTKKNIIWATDDYAELGEPYSFKKEILPELVTGEQDSLIQPRVEKALEHQTNRTRDKAEVFTPSWICNAQNNLVDEQWFGRKDVFNIQKEMSWKATADKIAFPDDRQHTWQKYVDAQRLEISCGEAPYLVSRYDTVTRNHSHFPANWPAGPQAACYQRKHGHRRRMVHMDEAGVPERVRL